MPAITLNVIGSKQDVTLDLPEPKTSVLHEVINWQLAKRRSQIASTKTRGEVKGSTRKIYAQKGTGRARHGSRNAPIFVGGGIVFGPRPRNYEYTLPKKVRKLGLRMAISARAKEGKLTLVENFNIENGKTKEFVYWASEHGFDGKEKVLLVIDDDLVRRAARNLPWVNVLKNIGLNAYDILRHDHLIIEASFFAEAFKENSEKVNVISTPVEKANEEVDS